ncbi:MULTISPECIES: chemotaxis protein CheW [Paenibacillus]|uniref:Chemotaxis protein CheW n=1 Tax=Paenibacillus lignilyticus TaxID=1172615 RepID=A0ABS5C6M8_9BACL|nr:chemotaxis protein CheW [Paenibacillus sp. BC26]MBP3961302.1 chemotaxis protein CheW [Paenibacillus lignilyticus]SFS59702.1 purine-binding chemotaxis protein CheW [Paenibacillus sp. BC26]
MSNYIVVGLNEEKFALPITAIQEIIKDMPVTEIPAARAHVRGVINLRGTIVPVIGLRSKFRMMESAPSAASRIVIVQTPDGEPVGLYVDRVEQVAFFSEILPTPDGIGGANAGYLSGIGKINDQLVSILHLPAILNTGGGLG